ncbi:receptor-like protein kinase [Gossypium australe]|uniref:Receptor-like protein kinase n=1 Tax=Gossypium australe TaxID=47621 RepID=A0A5B6WRK9_9ROSI|nr:receptor-like protein kinase [Gossypium australe]
MLIRYCPDPSHVFSKEEIEIQPDLTQKEKTVKTLACEVKELRKKLILLVKVQWCSHKIEESTWDSEETVKA